MRKLLLVLCLAIPALVATPGPVRAQDAFDFGDPLPLPPPPLEDSTVSPVAPPPAPLAVTPPPSAPTPTPLLPPVPSAPASPAIPVRPPVVAADSGPDAPPLTLPPAPIGDGVTAVALPPVPGTEIASAPPVATPAVDESPRPGKITGGRVNVRAGPNTQYESIAVLGTGSPLTVLSRHGDWFKVVFPADQFASVHRNYVDVALEGDVPEEGVRGTINQNDVDVHAFYWDKSTVVGKLQKGDAVTVRQERGQWFRIDAPPTARAYVSAQYVRVEGDGDIPVDSAPPPENPSVDLAAGRQDATGRLKLSENDRRAAELKEAYFRRLREQEKREEEAEAMQVNALTQALDDLESRLQAVDQQTSGMLTYPAQTTVIGGAEWAPPDPLYGGFTGWVENIGRVGGAPASFRLSKGGEVRFYLRSDRFNLAEFAGRRVWVNGNIELAAGAVANVLNVAELRPLTEAEIAEGMTQPPQAAAPQLGGVYGAPVIAPPQTVVTATTSTYGAPGAMISDPYAAPGVPASDPYAGLYAGQPGFYGETTTTTTTTTTDYYGVQTGTGDYFGTPAPAPQPYATPSYPAQSYAATTPSYAPAPQMGVPGGPAALPDHVGSTYPAGNYSAPMSAPSNLGGAYSPYFGEIESDYYEQPFISEVGP